MKKRFLSILMALCLMLSLLLTTVAAADVKEPLDNLAVAELNDTKYTTLDEAIEKAENDDIIYLLRAVELSAIGKGDTEGALTIDGAKKLTIDGKGNKIFASADTFYYEESGAGPSLINIQDGAEITLKNVTLDGAGVAKHGLNLNGQAKVFLRNVQINNNRWYAIEDNNGSTLAVEGLGTTGNGWGINIDKGASATFNNANIGEKSSIVYESSDEDSSLVINGGTYQNINVQGDAADGKIEINGANVTGSVINNGYVITVINDGTITAVENRGESGTNIEGGMIGKVTNYDEGDVDIGGGIINTVSNEGTGYIIFGGGYVKGSVTGAGIDIWGGIFDQDVSQYFTDGVVFLTITFDANGGVCNVGSRIIDGGRELSYLPTPTRSGYRFIGWTHNGNPITESFVVGTDMTLVAKWESTIPDKPSPSHDSDPSYSPVLDVSDGGSIRVNPRTPEEDEEVTITVDPDAGYELDELIVTDRNGREIDVTAERNGTYTFIQPRGRVTIEATFVRTGETADLPFVDVPASAYYYDAVAWAVDEGVTGGTTATTFSPNNACTRAQMVTFLWRAAGEPEPETTVNPFTDVSASAYYYEAVLWAVEQGITNGTSATTFSPDATVTRGQTVTFLWRNAGSPAASGSSFADVAADAYYATAVAWAANEGITSGTSATAFSPSNACTRAQIVTFLYRAQ